MTKKLLFAFFTSLFSTFLIWNTSFAANQASSKKIEQNQVLHVQQFKEGDLDIQFRYVNGKLDHIRFLNSGKEPVRIEVLEKSYILGSKDSVLITPPKIKYLIVKMQVYIDNGSKSPITNILPDRFKNQMMFKLPIKTNEDSKPVS